MNFRQNIAKYVSGNLTTDKLPEIGIIGIEEGLESTSLYILSGLNQNENFFQIDYYFKQTLLELNITLPDKRQAALEYVVGIIQEIECYKKDILVGTNEIIIKAINSYDFYSESNYYCYDSIGFEKIHGLFYTIDELSNATNDFLINKTNKELIEEAKNKLFKELIIWKDKIKIFDKNSTFTL